MLPGGRPLLTCLSTLTTRPIMLSSSTSSVSSAGFSPFSRIFLSAARAPLPTIWSTLAGREGTQPITPSGPEGMLRPQRITMGFWEHVPPIVMGQHPSQQAWLVVGDPGEPRAPPPAAFRAAHRICRLLILPSMSRWPAEYCSMTSLTS